MPTSYMGTFYGYPALLNGTVQLVRTIVTSAENVDSLTNGYPTTGRSAVPLLNRDKIPKYEKS
jgi:hypothetical protein